MWYWELDADSSARVTTAFYFSPPFPTSKHASSNKVSLAQDDCQLSNVAVWPRTIFFTHDLQPPECKVEWLGQILSEPLEGSVTLCISGISPPGLLTRTLLFCHCLGANNASPPLSAF